MYAINHGSAEFAERLDSGLRRNDNEGNGYILVIPPTVYYTGALFFRVYVYKAGVIKL